MGFYSLIVFALHAVIGVFALPSEILQREIDAGFYSSNWDDGVAKHSYSNGANGQYSVTWSGDKGNFVCGKGYNPGGPK